MIRPLALAALALTLALPGCALVRIPVKVVGAAGTAVIKAVPGPRTPDDTAY